MRALTILFMLFAADAVAQCPGGCSAGVQNRGFNGRIFASQGRTAFKPRVVDRVQYAPHVNYQPHTTYSSHVNYAPRLGYRAGDIMSVPRVVRPPQAYYYQRRPQVYYYSDILNYRGNFSYGVQRW